MTTACLNIKKYYLTVSKAYFAATHPVKATVEV